jgi:hypothetical protein
MLSIRSTSLAVAIMIASGFTTAALASGAQNAHVLGISTVNNGTVQVQTDTVRSGIASCAASNPTFFALNVTTPTGQAFYSQIIAAFSTGLYIDLGTTGVCDEISNIETVQWITIHR